MRLLATCPSLVCAGVAGVHKGWGKRGRPCSKHTEAATANFSKQHNTVDLCALPAWSSNKLIYQSTCRVAKHKRLLSCARVTRNSQSLHCRICAAKGSSFEKLAYRILGQMASVKAFAVEAFAVSGQIQHEGDVLHVNRHAWDIITLRPANLLIECKANSTAPS